MFRLLSALITVLALLSCGKDLPTLDGLDRSAWEADRDGCIGDRRKMLPVLAKEKDKLLALSEIEVVSVLGKPNANELHKRNQKFYRYLMSPGKECPASADTSSLDLVIRFNA